MRPRIGKRILGIVLIVFAFFLFENGSPHAQCNPDLTNYWRLDESSGSTFVDSVGGTNGNCSSSNCPGFSNGMIGNALLFDGINDAINVVPNASFNWGDTDSFSIEFWMKTDPVSTCSGNQVIVGRDDSSTDLHWWVGCQDGGQAAFYLFDTSGAGRGVSGIKDLTNGSWHHVVAFRDASTGELGIFVDGALEDSQPINVVNGFGSSTANLNIGWLNLGGGFHFQGQIDEVAIYNSALSETEIRSHYFLSRGYCEVCSDPVRIMPLGDSITYGYSVMQPDNNYLVGYRQKLYGDMTNGGYDIDFVGSLSSGNLAQPSFDVNHEGHGGWCAEGCEGGGLVPNIYNWLTNNPADIVLLHIGTNDIDAGIQDPNAVGRILDEIDRFSQDITVVLARIISRTDGKALQTTQFNEAVTAMALSRIENGDKIIIVDLENALNYVDDMDDSLHPNMVGYNKMAIGWLNAAYSFLPGCVEVVPAIFSAPVTGEVGLGQLYTYNVNATGYPAPIYQLVNPPSGMTIDQDTGLIQWMSTVVGTFQVTVKAVNALGETTQIFSLTVVNSVRVWLEGESGSLTAPMAIGSDSQASSGAYVWIPEGVGNAIDISQSTGSVAYTFSVPVAGNYVVWGRLIDILGNSFFVSMDSGSYALWDTVGGSTWEWDRVYNRGGADPMVYSLGAGQHTLVIKHREDGAKLDRILITSNMAYVPQGLGE
jgi:hypothetical protein